MNILQKYINLPPVAVFAFLISLLPFFKTYLRLLFQSNFDQLFHAKDYNMWNKIVRLSLGSLFFNLIVILYALIFKEKLITPSGSLLSYLNSLIIFTFIVFFVLWTCSWLIILFSIVFKLFKKKELSARKIKVFTNIMGFNGIGSVIIYAVVIITIYSQDFNLAKITYLEGLQGILVIFLTPIMLYIVYFYALPESLLFVKKKKYSWKMSMLEQAEVDKLDLILLYSMDGKNQVLCAEEDYDDQKVLYVFNRENCRYIRYEKVEIKR